MIDADHAGAGVDQSDPARIGSLLGESRPLQSFIDLVPRMRVAMAACDVQAFSFSPLSVLPKIALGKLSVEFSEGAILLKGNDRTRVIPLTTRSDYYRALLDALGRKESLALVPGWAAEPLRKHYKVSRQHDEYVMRTEDVRAFPGGRNRQMRGNVNKARRLCEVEHFEAGKLEEYAALVKTWYRQNAGLKFRTYDKTSIDWMLEHLCEFAPKLPDLTCLGIRYEGKLISMNMGCLLTVSMWTAYTQRFDREAEIKHGNMLGYNELAQRFASVPLENDGTADTMTIKEWKDRLVSAKLAFFEVAA